VQEAFARALRQQRKFRGDGSLEAWVWKIALNVALKKRRELAREWSLDDEYEAGTQETAPNSDLRAAVRALPPRRRLVVFLRYFADLSYAEIAAIAGISEGTVAATLAQAAHRITRPSRWRGGAIVSDDLTRNEILSAGPDDGDWSDVISRASRARVAIKFALPFS